MVGTRIIEVWANFSLSVQSIGLGKHVSGEYSFISVSRRLPASQLKIHVLVMPCFSCFPWFDVALMVSCYCNSEEIFIIIIIISEIHVLRERGN